MRNPLLYCTLLLCLLGGCGIDDQLSTQFGAFTSSYEEQAARIDTRSKAARALLEDPLYSDIHVQWQRDLEVIEGLQRQIEDRITKGDAIIENDDESQTNTLRQHLIAAKRALSDIGNTLDRIETVVTGVQTLQAKGADSLDEGTRAAYLAQTELPETTIRLSDHTVETFPDVAGHFRSLRSTLRKANTDINRDFSTAQQALDQSPPNWLAAQQAMSSVEALAAESAATRTIIEQDLAEVWTSWDDMLIDMAIHEGATVTFSHTIKRVTIKHPPYRDEDGTPIGKPEIIVADPVSKPVSEQEFKAHENDLGMVIAAKPLGALGGQVDTTPQPPGYQYVSDRQERSPRTGYWEQRNGSSFWVFYGQYALMRDLFWGPSYRPIGYHDYRDYRRHHSTRRPYYGRSTSGGSAPYGSKGTLTRTKYRSSKYMRSGGYRNTQYKRSGGTYRGSSYSSSRYGGSSGSRSSGGK